MVIRHVAIINFHKTLLESPLGDLIQSLEISYCSLNSGDLQVISNLFVNLNNLTLVKINLAKDPEASKDYTEETRILLHKIVLLKVDHEILNHLQTIQTLELEIIDSNENQKSFKYLSNFISKQKDLISLTIGEMSNQACVLFNHSFDFDFKLKKFNSIFCSSHSHKPQFEDNFILFLKIQSESLELIKLSGRYLPMMINKLVIYSLINLKVLEIEASSVPQETAFYESLPKNYQLKSLSIASSITKANFNGIKEIFRHYPCVEILDLMDTDEIVPNDLFHNIACSLKNLKKLTVLNFKKTFDPQSRIKSLEEFSIKIVTNLEQLIKLIHLHAETLKKLCVWWIVRDFESRMIEDIISLPYLSHLQVGGRFIANKRIYQVIKNDCKNLRYLHLIVNNYDEVKHLKFIFPSDKNLNTAINCNYFEEFHDREPLND